jgi:hypothetical protein
MDSFIQIDENAITDAQLPGLKCVAYNVHERENTFFF